jgi:hypothetical protein
LPSPEIEALLRDCPAPDLTRSSPTFVKRSAQHELDLYAVVCSSQAPFQDVQWEDSVRNAAAFMQGGLNGAWMAANQPPAAKSSPPSPLLRNSLVDSENRNLPASILASRKSAIAFDYCSPAAPPDAETIYTATFSPMALIRVPPFSCGRPEQWLDSILLRCV